MKIQNKILELNKKKFTLFIALVRTKRRILSYNILLFENA